MKRFVLTVPLLILIANLLTSCGGTPCEKLLKRADIAALKMQNLWDPVFATDDQIKENMADIAEFYEVKDELDKLGCKY